jgi:hypothetical protein
MTKRIKLDDLEPELIELLEDHPDQSEEAITLAYLIGKYTDAEVSVRKKYEDNKVVLTARQEVDLVGVANSLMALFKQKRGVRK